jgi:hypothetical protein
MEKFLKRIGDKIKAVFNKLTLGNICNSIEKNITTIINELGMNRLLHFFVGAFAVAMVSPLNLYWVIGMAIVVIGASYVKERFIDKVFDIKDFIASILGVLIAMIIYFLLK